MTREEELWNDYLSSLKEGENPASIKELLAFGMRWADGHPINPWESVNEELPKCDIKEEWGEKSGKMIFVDADGIYHIGEYCTGLYDDNKKDCFWWAYFEENPVINNVTHWMSIPELLKEDTK